MKSFQAQTHYELLEVSVGATAADVRSAFERLMRLYDDDQVALYGLIEPERAAALRARLKEALATLVDDERRDAYDLTIGLPPRERPAPPRVVAAAPTANAPTRAGSNSSTYSWSGSYSYVVSAPAPAPSAPATQVLTVAAPPVPVPVVAQPAPRFIAVPESVSEAPAEGRTEPAPTVLVGQPPVEEQHLPVVAVAPVAAGAVGLAGAPLVVLAPAVAESFDTVVEAPLAVVAAPVVAAPIVLDVGPSLVTPVEVAPPAPVPDEAPAAAPPVPVSPMVPAAVVEPAPAPPPEPAHAPVRPPIVPPPRPEAAAPVASQAVEPPPPVAEAPLPDLTPRLGDDVQLAIVPVRATPTREFRAEPRPKPFEVPAGVEINGDLLRQVRMARGLTMLQLSERTRISARHLENVEGDRYDALPATVYLRGILMNLARELGLDGLRVSKSYLTFVDAHRSKG
jgi:hypothetical protein